MSRIAGAYSSQYVGLNNLIHARLKQSESKELQEVAAAMDRITAHNTTLKEAISPTGFVGLDGKMRYIPGISFAPLDKSPLFSALKRAGELSEESLRHQIDYWAAKRKSEKAYRERQLERNNSLYSLYKKQAETTLRRFRSIIAANDAYLEQAFGINKKKTGTSPYDTSKTPLDRYLFGARAGGLQDYNLRTLNKDLTSSFSRFIAYDRTENLEQSFLISSARIADPKTMPHVYVVRLTGNDEVDLDKPEGELLPPPAGYLTYESGGSGGTLKTVPGSSIVELTPAELDTLKYHFKSPSSDEEIEQSHDYLSIMGLAGTTEKSYISKISLTKGSIDRLSSAATDPLIYKAKLLAPTEEFFRSLKMEVSGTFASDGSSAAANAPDGTLLDNILEGRITLEAREHGYKTKVTVDTTRSNGNTLILTPESSKLLNDGVDIYLTIKSADRATVQIDSAVMTAALTAPSTPAPAPAFPFTIALTSDTGAGPSDGVTSNGEVTVSGLRTGETWEYRTSAGGAWVTGTGTTFTLPEAVYPAGSVAVRTTFGGVTSPEKTLGAVEVDQTPPGALAIWGPPYRTVGGRQKIASGATWGVQGLEPSTAGGSVEFSLDAGVTWTNIPYTGTTASFVIPDGSYAAGDIMIRHSDLAGNPITVTYSSGDVDIGP